MPWVWDVLLIGVLVIAAYFRFTGIKWDDNHHLHPDERFLTMVESSISPVKNLGEYFDTANSSLNPNNRGYTFYVYGTLPIFIVRYIGGWLGQAGYDQINVVGRILSGIFDLGTIVMLYLIGKRLYRNARVGFIRGFIPGFICPSDSAFSFFCGGYLCQFLCVCCIIRSDMHQHYPP